MRRNLIIFFLLLLCSGCSRSQEPSPLEKAIDAHNYQLVDKLLKDGADPNERDQFGFSPLWDATYSDDTLMLKLLIDHGANTHLHYPPFGESLLSECVPNRMKAAKFLLEYGLNPNSPDTGSDSCPLIHAIYAENIPMVSLLLEFRANPNYLSPGNSSPLNSAIWLHKTLTYQANGNLRAKEILDSVSDLTRSHSFEIMQILLKSGASPNSSGAWGKGQTCLHDAASHCDSSAVQLLLQYGADRNAKDSDGNRPYDLAIKYGCADVARLLK